MTVARLRDEMPNVELVEWCAFLGLEAQWAEVEHGWHATIRVRGLVEFQKALHETSTAAWAPSSAKGSTKPPRSWPAPPGPSYRRGPAGPGIR